jgi:hypothetical protein
MVDKQTSDGFSDAMLSPVNEERQQSGETDRQTDRQTYVKLTDPLEREREKRLKLFLLAVWEGRAERLCDVQLEDEEGGEGSGQAKTSGVV